MSCTHCLQSLQPHPCIDDITGCHVPQPSHAPQTHNDAKLCSMAANREHLLIHGKPLMWLGCTQSTCHIYDMFVSHFKPARQLADVTPPLIAAFFPDHLNTQPAHQGFRPPPITTCTFHPNPPPNHLSANRFNVVDKRCGMALDAINPAQWALLERASLDTNFEPIPYRPPSVREHLDFLPQPL